MLVRVFHYGKAKKSGWNSFIFKNPIFEHELKHVCLCVHVRKFEFPAKTGPLSHVFLLPTKKGCNNPAPTESL
jgi:hypothetical protein